MKEKFPNGVTVGNNQIQITKKSRKEITNAKDAIWLKNNQPDVYADKLRSANHADEILTASIDYVSEGLMHERSDDIVDFGRGKVKIDVGGRLYNADVLVGTKEDGSMLLYDFVGMTKIEETQRTGEHRSVPHSRRASSLSDTSVQQNGTGVNAYSMQDGAQYDIAPRQFGNENAQRADALSDQVKQLLEGGTYETITNDAMVRQANERIDRDGLDSVANALAGMESWTPEDTASALVALVRASNENMLTTAAMIGMEIDRRGTKTAQNLQLYSVLKKLTPSGAIMEATSKANKANRRKGVPEGNIPVGNQAPVKRTGTGTATGTGNFVEKKLPEKLEKAYTRADSIKQELDKLPQDVSWDNPWRLPLNPAQYSPVGLLGSIIKYGLWDGKRNNGVKFDQRKFVMNLGRGVTGTGMMAFGLALVVSFIYDMLALFGVVPGVDESVVMTLCNTVLTLLVGVGVLADPTTKGLADSDRAMSYDEPK